MKCVLIVTMHTLVQSVLCPIRGGARNSVVCKRHCVQIGDVGEAVYVHYGGICSICVCVCEHNYVTCPKHLQVYEPQHDNGNL
jgi:hypothetical protein